MRQESANPKDPYGYGAINHANGRTIMIQAAYLNWVDWAGTALYAHTPLIELIKVAMQGLNAIGDNAGEWNEKQIRKHVQGLNLAIDAELKRLKVNR